MKLTALDLPTISFFIRVSEYEMKQVFEDVLLQYFYRDSLESLKTKLSKATAQIRQAYTFKMTLAEAICLRWTLEFWNEAQPDTYAKDVLQKYFSPLQ